MNWNIELFEAVRANDLVEASEILNEGQDPNVKDATGYTPLMIAAGLGNYQMCELLLSAGSDIHILDNRMGASALHKAAQGGVVPVAELLLHHGAFIDLQAPTHGHTPLHDASWHRNAAMVEFLLSQGANWDILASDGSLAKTWAQWAKDDDIVTIFEKYEHQKAEYVKDDRLFAAVENNDIETIKTLIANGIDVNQKARFRISPKVPRGITPLLLATREGYSKLVTILIDAGANSRIVDWLMKINSSP